MNGATGGAPPAANNISEPVVRVQHVDWPALHNKITPTADPAFSVEQCHARIGPNNARRLSGKEWLCAATRA
jgi:hypothetical protein